MNRTYYLGLDLGVVSGTPRSATNKIDDDELQSQGLKFPIFFHGILA